MKNRFRISAEERPGGVVLLVSVDGTDAGRLVMSRGAALAFVHALRSGDVGWGGSGAQVEIITTADPEDRAL